MTLASEIISSTANNSAPLTLFMIRLGSFIGSDLAIMSGWNLRSCIQVSRSKSICTLTALDSCRLTTCPNPNSSQGREYLAPNMCVTIMPNHMVHDGSVIQG